MESAAPIFRGIRHRLTLWYTGVVAGALLIFSVSLYLATSHIVLAPIDDSLKAAAARVAFSAGFACSGDSFGFGGVRLQVCYNAQGQLVSGPSDVINGVPPFVEPSLALRALQNGTASDTVDGGNDIGSIRRYAVRVTNPVTGTVAGVVQVGAQIGGQTQALDAELTVLLILATAIIALSALGGFFLANRALAPARLAYARQRDFIADASHELRTPLTMLRADAEVLLRGRNRFAPEDAALLEDVVAEAAHMSALANSMLNLAQLESDNGRVEQEVVDLVDVARDIARRGEALAEERGVIIGLEAGHRVLVVGERLLLDQAALVLLDNAIKYNRPAGQVTIRVYEQGHQAVLEVQDTGIGISPEHLPHLGERFYRVDKARSRSAGGAGLGVSIARGIARRHHGNLMLYSEPGMGTTASLVLPIAHGVSSPPPRHESLSGTEVK